MATWGCFKNRSYGVPCNPARRKVATCLHTHKGPPSKGKGGDEVRSTQRGLSGSVPLRYRAQGLDGMCSQKHSLDLRVSREPVKAHSTHRSWRQIENRGCRSLRWDLRTKSQVAPCLCGAQTRLLGSSPEQRKGQTPAGKLQARRSPHLCLLTPVYAMTIPTCSSSSGCFSNTR